MSNYFSLDVVSLNSEMHFRLIGYIYQRQHSNNMNQPMKRRLMYEHKEHKKRL